MSYLYTFLDILLDEVTMENIMNPIMFKPVLEAIVQSNYGSSNSTKPMVHNSKFPLASYKVTTYIKASNRYI